MPCPAHETIAGLIIFDVSPSITKPRLLLRDLKDGSSAFSGAIDLTRKKGEE